MKKMLIIVLAVIGLGVPAALYFLGIVDISGAEAEVVTEGEEDGSQMLDDHGDPIAEESDETGEALYFPLNPPFVVNFSHLGTLRYLQISLEVMYEDQQFIDRVEQEMPAIRNQLILLLSDQKYEKLASYAGKQELRGEMIAAINDLIVEDEQAAPPHGDIFITNFVMQ